MQKIPPLHPGAAADRRREQVRSSDTMQRCVKQLTWPAVSDPGDPDALHRGCILDILTALITGLRHFGLHFTIIQSKARQVDTMPAS